MSQKPVFMKQYVGLYYIITAMFYKLYTRKIKKKLDT